LKARGRKVEKRKKKKSGEKIYMILMIKM
jgi:hypothetical protein